MLERQVAELKRRFWGERDIILHSRDIRKCQNGFEILFDLNVKQRFYEAVNDLLGQEDMYVIVACSILKEPYIRQYGRLNDVYGHSLSFVLERAIFHVDNQCPRGDGRITAIVERRGKREDGNLQNFYNQLLVKGTYWVTSERMQSRMADLEFRWKTENIAGLQIADLIAYPITRHALNPNAVNPSLDVVSANIFREGEKLMGFKVYPHTEIKKSHHELDDSSDRGHPNPGEMNNVGT